MLKAILFMAPVLAVAQTGSIVTSPESSTTPRQMAVTTASREMTCFLVGDAIPSKMVLLSCTGKDESFGPFGFPIRPGRSMLYTRGNGTDTISFFIQADPSGRITVTGATGVSGQPSEVSQVGIKF